MQQYLKIDVAQEMSNNVIFVWAFHPIFVTWFLVVFGNQVTKTLCNSLSTFFTEQGKTGKNGTKGYENLTTYFKYFGSFDEKQTYENM